MRMAIPMMFVAVAPAALACSKLLALRRPRPGTRARLIVALLLLGGWNTARIYGNQWNARYVTPSAELAQMNAWFREHTPAGGESCSRAGRCTPSAAATSPRCRSSPAGR